LFLKKLEIHGFKSFADKTELLFEPGVTAVVGPNGCGKTNVSDSVRWVMGEQSAKGLRASEMTDVIFNGTDTRKPSSMAEVTLVLSNEDKTIPLEYNEISITRRVYRSGEAEYLINKAPARLKDVKELFMGTGLGTSAYSVMAQGQMDQIITSKPAERRAIFEEAAGITRYKARKVEALRKLDATEQNLVRVSDIIAEIKRQISTLERQAKQAEKYREYKENLGKLQVLIHLDKAHKLKNKLKDLHHKMGQVRERLETIQGETHKLEHDEKAQRNQLNQVEEELTQAREQAYKIGSEVEVTQGRAEGTRRHRGMLTDQKQRNEQQIVEGLSRIEQLKIWVAERLSLLENKDAQKAEKESLRKQLQDQLVSLDGDLSSKNQDLQNKSATAMQLVTKTAQMKAELESLKAQDEEISRRVNDLASQIEKLANEIIHVEQRLVQLQDEKNRSQTEQIQLDEQILQHQTVLSQSETRIEELNANLKQSNNTFSEVRSRYGVLEELQNKLTGYDPGVKVVLQAKQSEPLMWQEVLGVVANLISVDQAYEAAVEAILGSQLQSLVVRNRATADKVVSFLKSEGQGKVSIFILDDLTKLQNVSLPDGLLSENGVEASVFSLLKYDPSVEPVVKFLFEQDVFAKDLASAEALMERYPRVRFVTKEGDRLGPLGFMKAGSEISGVSLLGRHREMNELGEKVKQVELDIQELELTLGDAKKNRKDAEDHLLAAESRRQHLRIRLAEGEKEITQIHETLGRLHDQKAAEEIEKAEVERHWSSDKIRVQELYELLSQSEQEQNVTQEEISVARHHLQNLQVRKDDISKQIMQVEVEIAAMDEVAHRSKEEAERYQTEQNQLTQSVEQKRQENSQIDEQEQQLSLDLTTLEQKAGGLSETKQSADDKVKVISEKREKIAAETHAWTEKVHRSRAKSEDVQKELHGFEVQEAQINVESRNIEEKLQVEYKVDLDNAPVALEKDFDSETAEKESIELRAKIERLGLVNMVAVEEYDELNQRYKFLTEQRDDLLKAKDDLQKAINKINLTSKELFTSTFATVQENFKDTFQRLFEGGRAELIMVDEGDVLESGIEIVARPPGKRLQSVSLLSGGEKALTAIALLFALFMVKPSPFCLLDEIDAPLDDVNVSRFTHLLREFSKKTQFIMITHSKVSMETADVMYGVTMQESGVSKIISTKFRENAPEESAVS
jgi:chromosome segregation protein